MYDVVNQYKYIIILYKHYNVVSNLPIYNITICNNNDNEYYSI